MHGSIQLDVRAADVRAADVCTDEGQLWPQAARILLDAVCLKVILIIPVGGMRMEIKPSKGLLSLDFSTGS